MEFKYCVIGDTCYEYIRNEEAENNEKEKKFRQQENIIPFHKYEMFELFEKENDNIKINEFSSLIISSEMNPEVNLPLSSTGLLIEQFWYALALCHTCSIQADENGLEEYTCVSPDSIELVKAARDQGWKFTQSNSMRNKNIQRTNNRF